MQDLSLKKNANLLFGSTFNNTPQKIRMGYKKSLILNENYQ